MADWQTLAAKLPIGKDKKDAAARKKTGERRFTFAVFALNSQFMKLPLPSSSMAIAPPYIRKGSGSDAMACLNEASTMW